MNKIFLISLTLIFLAFIGEQDIIEPGKFIGPFSINKTKRNEIVEKIGKGHFEKRVFIAPHCGMKQSYKALVYKKKGITFTFNNTNCDTIYSITINEKYNAKTKEGIRVGFSTRTDIKKIYGTNGEEYDSGFDGSIHYNNLGISFFFKHEWNKKNETDTVTFISIYPEYN